MEIVKSWVDRLQMHTLRWLVRKPGPTWLMVGTLAFSGFAAAALNAPPAAPGPQPAPAGSQTLLSSYGCYSDPDGDGHIFCDGSVAISKLPASFGYCFTDQDGDGRIICEGSGH
jgi:hypothetical protein